MHYGIKVWLINLIPTIPSIRILEVPYVEWRQRKEQRITEKEASTDGPDSHFGRAAVARARTSSSSMSISSFSASFRSSSSDCGPSQRLSLSVRSYMIE